MRYAIIDDKKKTRFAGRDYDSVEDANKRLDVLKGKFGDRFSLAVVGVDEQGSFHKLSEKTSKEKTS